MFWNYDHFTVMLNDNFYYFSMTASIIIVIFLLLISAFFSASETAILNASNAKILKLKREGNLNAVILSSLQNQKEKLIGAILLANSFANIASSTITTSIVIELLGDNGSSLLIATAIMTVIVVIYCEVLPKTYAVRHSEKVALQVAPMFIWIFRLLGPFIFCIHFIVDKTIHSFSNKNSKPHSISGLELLRGTIELHHEEGHVVQEDKYMLGGIIDLETTTVDSVMIHRNEIVGIDISIKILQIVEIIINSPYSRLPVWEKEQDNILGIIHIKDVIKLLKFKKMKDLTVQDFKSIIRPAWYIPSTTTLKSQLAAFRHNHVHSAFVVNEYGELMGIVTLEDIVEEVVGQIEDEHDVSRKNVVIHNKDNSITVNSEISIKDVNRHLNWQINGSDVSTIGGLLLHMAKGIPTYDQEFVVGNYILKLEKKENHKIQQVKIWENSSKE